MSSSSSNSSSSSSSKSSSFRWQSQDDFERRKEMEKVIVLERQAMSKFASTSMPSLPSGIGYNSNNNNNDDDVIDDDDNLSGAVGWSSAYSVKSILMQLQTFLMELEEEENLEVLQKCLPLIPRAVLSSLSFECPTCAHRAPDSCWPPILTEKDYFNSVGDRQRQSQSDNDGDDGYVDQSNLIDAPMSESSESDSDASQAPPPPSSSSLPTDIEESLRCFHTRRSFREDVLGIGIGVEYKRNARRRRGRNDRVTAASASFGNNNNNAQIHQVTPSFDLLSHSAFYQDSVRHSVLKQQLTHWLPLWINAEHGSRGREYCKQGILLMCRRSAQARFSPRLALDVCCKLMNSMVVALMDGKLHASIKALEGYCAFHRLLLSFVHEYPALQASVDVIVGDFGRDEHRRTKSSVPNLGEFLPLLTVSALRWADIASAYLAEAFTRNVYWLARNADKRYGDPTALTDAERIEGTFQNIAVSTRLLMFHVVFLELVGRPTGKSRKQIARDYDERHGMPTPAQRNLMQQACRRIVAVHTWAEFFEIIKVPMPAPAAHARWLRASVHRSIKLGYHKLPKPPGVCRAFERTGECRHAKRCRFLHLSPQQALEAKRSRLARENLYRQQQFQHQKEAEKQRGASPAAASSSSSSNRQQQQQRIVASASKQVAEHAVAAAVAKTKPTSWAAAVKNQQQLYN
jgi:Zinc finger C-x8-C-x5-C-x3-H type (and similar)